jgi:hypothetical protein
LTHVFSVLHGGFAVMRQIISNGFQEPFQAGELPVYKEIENGLGQSEKSEKKAEYEQMEKAAVPSHI